MSDERVQVSERELDRRWLQEQRDAEKHRPTVERPARSQLRVRPCRCEQPIMASDLDGKRRCIKCGREPR